MKQHGQLLRRLVAVVLAEFEHTVLHDVQGCFLVAYMKPSALESTLFNAFEELGELLCSGQGADKKRERWLAGAVAYGKSRIIALRLHNKKKPLFGLCCSAIMHARNTGNT